MKATKLTVGVLATLIAMPLGFTGCDKRESKSSTTTTTTRETPQGDSKTTKTTEEKTVVDPK